MPADWADTVVVRLAWVVAETGVHVHTWVTDLGDNTRSSAVRLLPTKDVFVGSKNIQLTVELRFCLGKGRAYAYQKQEDTSLH